MYNATADALEAAGIEDPTEERISELKSLSWLSPLHSTTFMNNEKVCVRQSSRSDVKSDFGRISSNLLRFATEFWTNSPKSDSNAIPKSTNLDL